MHTLRRPAESLFIGHKMRPAALPKLPTTMLRCAAPSLRPRSCPSFTITGLNSSMVGAASSTMPKHSQNGNVRSISPGKISLGGLFLFFPCSSGFGLGAGGFTSRQLAAVHTASITPPKAPKAQRIPSFSPSTRTQSVKNPPESPTAPPISPVTKPFLPAYHFWAQLITAGYKNALPSPAGRLNSSQKASAFSGGKNAAPINAPLKSAVPHSPAVRGPLASCKNPPSRHPRPYAATKNTNASPTPSSCRA